MELTKALATNIVKTQTQYDDLPKEVKEATKRSVLDTIGVIMPPTTLGKVYIDVGRSCPQPDEKSRCICKTSQEVQNNDGQQT